MKKIIFILTWVAFPAVGIFAQSSSTQTGGIQKSWTTPNEKGPDVKAKQAADKLIHIAQLTEAQYNRIVEVYKGFYAQSESPTAVNNRNAKLKSILNPQQWQKAEDAGLIGVKGSK